MDDSISQEQERPAPRPQPLSAVDRRVAGVLVEKAKTTPNAYPLTLNAICTACNQKSNRFPVMNVEPDEVEESLERLRQLGAAGLVEGYGRVAKHRHYLYDWLGVDKVELAVMAELLLRGAQTEGELRGRAARMEPIPDLAALRPVLASLKSKGLVIPLTPEGRGYVVAHGLYPPDELERIKARYGAAGAASVGAGHEAVWPPANAGEPPSPIPAPMVSPAQAPEAPGVGADPEIAQALQRQIEELRSQLAQLRSDLEDLTAMVGRTEDEFHRLRDELGG